MPSLPPVDHADDHILLARIAAGDMAAMSVVYERYASMMTGVVIAVLGTRDEAEDVVHDVFVRLVDRAQQYSPGLGTVRAWLSAITRNACIDRKRRRATVAKKRAYLAVEEPATSDEHLSRLVDGRRALDAIDALGPIYRETILDLYGSDLSCSEVAGRHAIPIGTVKSRAARAIDAVRTSWEEAA